MQSEIFFWRWHPNPQQKCSGCLDPATNFCSARQRSCCSRFTKRPFSFHCWRLLCYALPRKISMHWLCCNPATTSCSVQSPSDSSGLSCGGRPSCLTSASRKRWCKTQWYRSRCQATQTRESSGGRAGRWIENLRDKDFSRHNHAWKKGKSKWQVQQFRHMSPKRRCSHRQGWPTAWVAARYHTHGLWLVAAPPHVALVRRLLVSTSVIHVQLYMHGLLLFSDPGRMHGWVGTLGRRIEDSLLTK